MYTPELMGTAWLALRLQCCCPAAERLLSYSAADGKGGQRIVQWGAEKTKRAVGYLECVKDPSLLLTASEGTEHSSWCSHPPQSFIRSFVRSVFYVFSK